MFQARLVFFDRLPREAFQTSIPGVGLLPLQTALLDRIDIGLHLQANPVSFLAGVGQADPLERPKPHCPLTAPQLKAIGPLGAAIRALMEPQTLPIAVFTIR